LELVIEGKLVQLIQEAKIGSQLQCYFIIPNLNFFVENHSVFVVSRFSLSNSKDMKSNCHVCAVGYHDMEEEFFTLVHMIYYLHSLGICYVALNFSKNYVDSYVEDYWDGPYFYYEKFRLSITNVVYEGGLDF
jgi:hypothetical protein